RRRHTSSTRDWSSDVCSSDLMRFTSRPPFAGRRDVNRIRLVRFGEHVSPRGAAHGGFERRIERLHLYKVESANELVEEFHLPPRSEERRVGKERKSREVAMK